MQITLKLYAGLGEFLPRDARDNSISLDVNPGASPHEVLDRFHVPRERAHLVLLNGVYLNRTERDTHALADRDVVAVWPPVVGG